VTSKGLGFRTQQRVLPSRRGRGSRSRSEDHHCERLRDQSIGCTAPRLRDAVEEEGIAGRYLLGCSSWPLPGALEQLC
jgi:hypothetical protein